MELDPWDIPDDIADEPARLAALGYGPYLRPLDAWNVKKLAHRERGQTYSVRLLERLIREERLQLGLRLHGSFMAVDIDGPDTGLFEELRRLTPQRVQTTRGEHLHFRTDADHKNMIHPAGLDVDLLWHAAMPLPPSVNWQTGWRYRWLAGPVRPEELPLFPMEILAEFDRPAPVPAEVRSRRNILGAIHDIRRYLATIVAVEGRGGDKATFRAACKAAEATGNYHDALQVMLEWNETNARPRWPAREIERKVRDAFKYVTLPPGMGPQKLSVAGAPFLCA